MGDPTITFTSPPLGYSYQGGSPAYVRNVSHNTIGPFGSTTYYYWVVAIYPSGTVPPPTPITVRNAPDVLSPTNNIVINWVTPNALVTGYSVLRTTTPVFPGSSNTAVVVNTTANTVTDNGSALVAFTLTSTPLPRGTIYIDGSGSTPILVSTLGFKTGSITFNDGTQQSTAATGSNPYNWTQNVQSNGFQLLGLTTLTVNNPSGVTTVAVQSGSAVSVFQLSTSSLPATFQLQVNSGTFFFSEPTATSPNNRIIIPSGNPTRIGLTTGASFTPAHLLHLNQDDAAKPTSTTWTIVSDIRTKRNIKPLEGGLRVIERLEPNESEYNGLAHTPGGGRVVSFDPDHLAKILPHSVSSVRGKLNPDDKEETDIKGVTTHEIILHLVLAVQQLSRKVK